MIKHITIALLLATVSGCKTAVQQKVSTGSYISGSYKTVLDKKLPVCPNIKSNNLEGPILTLVGGLLRARDFIITDKDDLGRYLQSTFDNMAKDRKTLGVKEAGEKDRIAAVQLFTIRAGIAPNGQLDSLSYQVVPVPSPKGIYYKFIPVPKEYIANKNYVEAITAMIDSLTVQVKKAAR